MQEAARRLEESGQAHLVAHARTLEADAASAFLARAAEQPWAEVVAALRTDPAPPPPDLRQPHALSWKRHEREGGVRQRLGALGLRFLRGGRVAGLLLAGGQGTRLGHPGAKGTFVLEPEPDRTLYGVLGERVAAAGRAAGRPVPLLVVLVSGATEDETRDAFDRGREAWGLGATEVRFVRQGELPVLTPDGHALLAGPGELATAPDGHGGAFEALARAGLLEEMRARGIDAIAAFQVDNPLALPFDPVMLGWMVERRAHVVGKAVRKRAPDERVGVFARDLRGRHRIVEYTEVPEGGLPPEVDLGSIAVGAYGVAFLDDLWRAGVRLPLHRARKKAPHWVDGRLVTPDAPNAIKLERFIFDLLPHARRVEVHEVPREREFAPVKNGEGDDSPETARALVAAEVARLRTEAGLPGSASAGPRPLHLLEYHEFGVPAGA